MTTNDEAARRFRLNLVIARQRHADQDDEYAAYYAAMADFDAGRAPEPEYSERVERIDRWIVDGHGWDAS
jgi:hypothetical protein